jgi:hypothetical protein
MSLQPVPLLSLDFLPSRPVEIEVSQAPISSDAGLLPIRQFDQAIQFTQQFAAALQDRRDLALIRQSCLSMVRQRIYGILAGYEDQNDHDALRFDPVFKLIADRLPDDSDLASQPTLSRLENAVSISDLWRLRDVLVDLFIQSFETPPPHITLDLDAFDDPAHGEQQLTLFHGFYEQYQYLPIAITCAENDIVVLVGAARNLSRGFGCRQRSALSDATTARGMAERAYRSAGRQRLRGAQDVRGLQRIGTQLHVRHRHEFPAQGDERGTSEPSPSRVRADRSTTTVFPIGRVSGQKMADAATGGHQG